MSGANRDSYNAILERTPTLIYLASPYSADDPNVREQRFHDACRVAAELMRRGEAVFSAIAHTHPIAQYGLPTDWDYWQAVDRKYLACCDEVLVVMLPGWDESVGVAAEIQIAREQGKPVRYLDLETFERRDTPS